MNSIWSLIGRWYDARQIRRARQAYTSVSGWHSARAGYEGMVEEMQWGWTHLSKQQRVRADDRVFAAILGGPLAVFLIRLAAMIWPKPTARLFTRLAPWALHWLVGTIEQTGPLTNDLPHCRFHQAGGDDLCLNVCRAPTQRYYAGLGVPIAMHPDMQSLKCHWVWGTRPSHPLISRRPDQPRPQGGTGTV